METKYWKLSCADDEAGRDWNGSAADLAAIAEAAELLQAGNTVAFPTETVYGLGADARDTEAVEAIFRAKGRPSDNPLIVHIAAREALEALVTEVSPTAVALMDAYWPGPLTLVLPLRPGALSPRVTAGLDTVGVRMPDHPVALALLAAADCPVAAPSANRSGRPSPTQAGHVLDDLAGKIGGVLDGGAAGVGLESTVVQVQPDGSVAVLRPGGITAAQLAAVAGEAAVIGHDDAADFTPPHEAAEAASPSAPGPAEPSASGAARPSAPRESCYAPGASASPMDGTAASPAPGASTAASETAASPTPGALSPARENEAPSASETASSPVPGATTPSTPEAPSTAREAVAYPAPVAAGNSSPAPRAPGMKYAHYAPRGWLGVVRASSPTDAARTAAGLLAAARGRGESTGLLLFEEHLPLYPADAADCVVSLGPLASPETVARSLYAALRRFDEAGATYILAESCPEEGLGSAIMNRLMKAAAGRVIDAE